MAWVDGVGGVPPQFEDPPKLGGTWREVDFGQIMDRLAPPQGFVGREFPDIQKPARTLGEPPPAATIRVGPQAVGPVTDLGRLFKPLEDFIGEVNSTALYASDMQQAFASGENVDLHDVMIAAEKSSVATQLTSQVRTKLLEAYQEIWRMQV